MVYRILVASDSFKGTIDSAGVGAAFAEGWHQLRPDDVFDIVPVADGGEGTLEAVHAAIDGSEYVWVSSVDPQGEYRDARWLRLPDGTGVVELAETCGLGLTNPLQPMTAHTTTFGEVIAHALNSGVTSLVLAIGGSASTDGGVGMLRALGATFVDVNGAAIEPGGLGLSTLAKVDLSTLRPLPAGGVRVFVDVDNPLTGDRGAARVFGPQKGATPEMIQDLDSNLHRFAELTGGDGSQPGAGAAGGTGFALQLWGAQSVSGAQGITELLGLEARIAQADLVITGEGAYDSQTAHGKLPSWVNITARTHQKPVLLVAGVVAAETTGFSEVAELATIAGSQEAAMADARAWITEAGVQSAAGLAARLVSHQAGTTSDKS